MSSLKGVLGSDSPWGVAAPGACTLEGEVVWARSRAAMAKTLSKSRKQLGEQLFIELGEQLFIKNKQIIELGEQLNRYKKTFLTTLSWGSRACRKKREAQWKQELVWVRQLRVLS